MIQFSLILLTCNNGEVCVVMFPCKYSFYGVGVRLRAKKLLLENVKRIMTKMLYITEKRFTLFSKFLSYSKTRKRYFLVSRYPLLLLSLILRFYFILCYVTFRMSFGACFF